MRHVTWSQDFEGILKAPKQPMENHKSNESEIAWNIMKQPKQISVANTISKDI